MGLLHDILDHNRQFVEAGEYIHYSSNKFPEKKLAILSCMDTRILELLPAAMGIKNGDAKLIRNAGAVVTHPWGSVMRSLLVAVLELQVEEIMVVAHHDCGMRGLNPEQFLGHAVEQGIPEDRIVTLRNAGINLYEEMMLQEADYHLIEPHKKVHANFVSKMNMFQSRYNNGDNEALDELLNLLEGWLFRHIRLNDHGYVDSVKKAGVR